MESVNNIAYLGLITFRMSLSYGLTDPAKNTLTATRHPVDGVDGARIMERHDMANALKNQVIF